jgi:hypothetical protein
MIIAEFVNSGKNMPWQGPLRRGSAWLLDPSPHGENVFVDNALIN